MARYIDAELFAERLLNAWDTADKEKKTEIVAILSDIVTPILVGTPTADVAPRAEVEELQAELDDFTVASLAECKACGEKMSKVIADLQEKLSKAKAEVAREIFEEIEKLHLHITNDFDARRYEELKKKYTEGKK